MSAILVIDDEAVLVSLLTAVLTKNGYHVVSASNGSRGLELAGMVNPDLIMLDANMPVMDGFETLRRLRAVSKVRATPVLMLTASRTESDVRTFLQLGADDYLCKPVVIEQLMTRIRRLLKRAPASSTRRTAA